MIVNDRNRDPELELSNGLYKSRMSQNYRYTPQDLLEWKKRNPCVTKDGKNVRHRKGTCTNCQCCLQCSHPPWCSIILHVKEPKIVTPNYQENSTSGNKRAPERSALRIGGLYSPTKKRKARVTTSSQNELQSHLLDECDSEARIEKEDQTNLANSLKDELNDLDGVSSTKSKGIKLANLVKKIIIPHLGKGVEHRCNLILDTVIERLDIDDFRKGSRKLSSNIAKLVIDGSTTVRRIATALLLDSLSTPAAKELLLKNNYSSCRQQQVKNRK